MKSVYDEYYRVPKHGKVKEKVLLGRITVCLAVMIYCIFSMGLSAYAYFSYTITSSVNIIQSAHYGIEALSNDGLQYTNDYYILDNRTNPSDGTFNFTLYMSDKSTTTFGGYGHIKVVEMIARKDSNGLSLLNENDEEMFDFSTDIMSFYSSSIDSKEENLQYSITVPSGYIVAVSFVGEWGTCSYATDDSIVLDVNKLTSYQLITPHDELSTTNEENSQELEQEETESDNLDTTNSTENEVTEEETESDNSDITNSTEDKVTEEETESDNSDTTNSTEDNVTEEETESDNSDTTNTTENEVLNTSAVDESAIEQVSE